MSVNEPDRSEDRRMKTSAADLDASATRSSSKLGKPSMTAR